MLNVTEIAARISNPSITKANDAEDLKVLTEKYPYTQLFSILYLQSLKNAGDIHFEDELKKHSFRITDRVQLFQLIESSHAVSSEPTPEGIIEATIEEVEAQHQEFEEKIQEEIVEEIVEVSEQENSEPEAITNKPAQHRGFEVPESDVHDDEIEEFDETIITEATPKHQETDITESEEILTELTSEKIAFTEIEAAELASDTSEINEAKIETEVQESEVEIGLRQSQSVEDRDSEEEELYSVEESLEKKSELESDSDLIDPLEQSIAHHIYAVNYRLDSLSEEEERKLKEKQPNSSTETEFIPKRSEKNEGASFTKWLHANSNYEAPDEASITPAIVPHFSDFDPSKALFGEQNRPKQEFFSAPKKAKRSLTEETLPVSETLAKVYSMQGNYPKAIAAYEQLMVIIPEKKSFFASLIEELKTKLNT